MADDAYPAREPFFAHKYTRLLFRCCVANEIGPEACYMLVQIAHTEDAARYRKAVTYFNEQLINVCGFSNVKSLDRARKKAIDAGWLNYKPGAKSKPGRYFVTVPQHATDIPDGSAESDFHPGYLGENDQANGTETKYLGENDQVSGREAGSIREVSGREAGSIRETNGQHSSLSLPLVPSPSPSPKEDCPATASRATGPAATGPAATPKPEPAKIENHKFPVFGCIAGSKNSAVYWTLQTDQIDEWQGTFPSVDVNMAVREAHAWVKGKWSQRKTADGMLNFLRGWIAREQNRGGGASNGKSDPRGNFAAGARYLAMRMGEPSDG